MAKAPVSVSISIEKNRFVFEIEYRGDMYHEETIRYLADNLETTAEGILRECDPADIRLMFEEKNSDGGYSGTCRKDLHRSV